MDNTIKIGNGRFTIKYVPKHYKIEMFDIEMDYNILNVEYSSDSFILRDEEKVRNIFKELEPQIIQIMKFFVNENIEFYKHFDIDPNYTLISDYANFTPKGDNKYFHINYPKFLKAELKSDSLQYLKGLTDEQKRNAYGF
jgi:hypothetical protein